MNVPLSDRDYADIRANVMREIRMPDAGRRSPGIFWFAFAALAIAFVVLIIPTHRQHLHGAARSQPVVGGLTVRRPRVVVEIPTTTGDWRVAAVEVAAVRVPHKRHPHIAHKPEYQTAVRMDIQTADPNIRIIWIAR